MTPFFSIIVPVYKVEPYIDECINSVLNQNFADYELILVDDGSPDNCPEICDAYGQADSRIHVIHKQNGGLSDARNAGMDKAMGQYIVFLDSDDFLATNALETIYSAIKEFKMPDIVMNRYQNCSESSIFLNECAYKYDIDIVRTLDAEHLYQICTYRLPEFWSTAWMFVYRRKYLEENNFYFIKGFLHEDEEWSPRVLLNATSFGFNNQIAYYYRCDRSSSIMNSVNIQKEFDKLMIIDCLLKESDKPHYSLFAKSLLKERCAKLYIVVMSHLRIYQMAADPRAEKLEKALEDKKGILLLRDTWKANVAWVMCVCVGVSTSAKLFWQYK